MPCHGTHIGFYHCFTNPSVFNLKMIMLQKAHSQVPLSWFNVYSKVLVGLDNFGHACWKMMVHFHGSMEGELVYSFSELFC